MRKATLKREKSIESKNDLKDQVMSSDDNLIEQEIVDLTNEIARNGLIFFPEFCEAVLARFRAENEEEFKQNMFKVMMQVVR